LSNVSNQGITVLPGRRFHAGRASAPSVRPREETNQDAQQEAELQAMPINDDHQKARRFREAALPYLDDVYTLARYLLRDASDAEDAVQECYLRALKHFDSYRGPAMKPWLFAILRNVCHAEYARRAHSHARPKRTRRRKCCAAAMPVPSAS
jgi:DNA-directed RNA polymerase specialized sigma24 family protein